MVNDTVRDYYESCGRMEWTRSEGSGYSLVEREVILHYLDKYLRPGSVVLDAGPGAGRYTLDLVRRGHRVVVLMDSPTELGELREEISNLPDGAASRVLEYVEGRIDDLSMFPDHRFDAVMSMGGSLSHLVDCQLRERAAEELYRVCRPDGRIFVTVLSFYGALRKVLSEYPEDVELLSDFIESRLDPAGTGYKDCFFFTPEEMVDLLARSGIEVQEYVGVHGLSAHLKARTEECLKHPERWKVWMEIVLRTCNHPSVVGVSDHILAVGLG